MSYVYTCIKHRLISSSFSSPPAHHLQHTISFSHNGHPRFLLRLGNVLLHCDCQVIVPKFIRTWVISSTSFSTLVAKVILQHILHESFTQDVLKPLLKQELDSFDMRVYRNLKTFMGLTGEKHFSSSIW